MSSLAYCSNGFYNTFFLLGPTCQSSMLDMKRFWEYLDGEVLATEMPKEYENFLVDILCKDCHKVNLKKNVQFLSIQCEIYGFF